MAGPRCRGEAVTRIVVVGAGIAGLAAAHALRDVRDRYGQPVEVVIVEGADRIGGKLLAGEVGGVVVDGGAESFLARVPEARELAEACGLGDRLVAPATTSASLWARGRLRPMPAGTVLGVPSSLRSLSGILSPGELARAAADRVLPGDPPGEEDVAVGQWVRRRLGAAVADRLVDPLLGGVYAGRAELLSLQATVPQLVRTERSALAAARASLPATAPALASTHASAGTPVFLTLAEGLGSLPQAVLTASGARLINRRTVRRVMRAPHGWRVVHGPTTDEQVIEAHAVILAVPPAPAARLLTDVAPEAATDLATIETASMAIVTTVWRRTDIGPAPGSGYLVPAATRPRRAVKAVTFASAKWPHLAGGDTAVVRCSIGRYGDTTDLQRDDDELVALAVAELTGHAGFRGHPPAARVTRWGGGLPQYTVGHRAKVARIRAAVAAQPGLAVCGAAYDGVGVPACIRTGRQAARDVLDALGAQPRATGRDGVRSRAAQ